MDTTTRAAALRVTAWHFARFRGHLPPEEPIVPKPPIAPPVPPDAPAPVIDPLPPGQATPVRDPPAAPRPM